MSKAEKDEAIDRLATSLQRYGINPDWCRAVANGFVLILREWCWRNLTDLLGSALDVDRILESPLPPETLAKVLWKAGLISTSKGVFYMPSAYTERPVYVDKRWRRAEGEARSYRESKGRAEKTALEGAVPVVETEPPPAITVDLFGKPFEDDQKGQKDAGTRALPGYQEIVDYWFERWCIIEGNGASYPFCATDGRFIRFLIKATRDADEARSVIDAYLNCRDRWYAGKPLKKLIGDLPRFIAAAHAGGSGTRGELPYGGTLPSL